MTVERKSKSKAFRDAAERLTKFRRELADVVDPDRPQEDYRPKFDSDRPTNELHGAVDAILAYGDAYDVLILCLELERSLKASADAAERTEKLLGEARHS